MKVLNANVIDTINIFPNKKEILGYKCIYNEQAIFRDGNIIDTKIELKNHSPLGLSWGYNGSGPTQAALAVLCDFTKDDEFSLKYYMDFKNDVICQLPRKDCVLKYSEIQHWVDLKKLVAE